MFEKRFRSIPEVSEREALDWLEQTESKIRDFLEKAKLKQLAFIREARFNRMPSPHWYSSQERTLSEMPLGEALFTMKREGILPPGLYPVSGRVETTGKYAILNHAGEHVYLYDERGLVVDITPGWMVGVGAGRGDRLSKLQQLSSALTWRTIDGAIGAVVGQRDQIAEQLGIKYLTLRSKEG